MGVRKLQIKVCHSLKDNIWFANQIRKSYKKKWHFIKRIRPKQLLRGQPYFISLPDSKIHKQWASSSFRLRLKEKQKLKRYYGTISERTFRNLCKNNKTQNIFISLESRLDSIIQKIAFARSPFSARQLISHGFFYVNGKRIKRKGYPLKSGDIISTSSKKTMFSLIHREVRKALNKKPRKYKHMSLPLYLEVDYSLLFCIIGQIPNYNEIFYPLPFKGQLVKEFYI